jgi:hypothetical protein
MSDGKDKANGSAIALAPIPEVLTTASHEVRLLSDGVSDLQELIGNLVVAGAFGGSHSLYELQSLDRIAQGLEAVADYLNGVSKLSSPEWIIDVAEASRSVKLAELSDRLNGNRGGGAEPPQAGAGDFDDFALTG